MTQAAKSMDQRVETLSKEAEDLHLVEFWRQREALEPTQPKSSAVPYQWKWSEIGPRMMEASETVVVDNAERRAMIFSNPGLGGKPYATDTLLGAYSLYNQGEKAPVHRHTPSACRFALEGNGGYTTVEGEKCIMSRGDLVLTPNGTWHDHGNDGADPVIWFDVLDLPLVEHLKASMFSFDYTEMESGSNTGKPITKKVQSISERPDHSKNLYGAGGVVPLFGSHKRGTTTHSPMFVYRWEQTYAALQRMRDYEGSAYDGIIAEYTDPVTNQSAMSSMSMRSQLIRPSEHTFSHRHMSSSLYCVLEGSGYTEVEGTQFEWGRNDVFAVPSWLWHEHVNTSKTSDAILYSVTDEPTFRKLNLYREEGKSADGSVSVIV